MRVCVVSIGEHVESNWSLCQGTIQLRGDVCGSGRLANSVNRSWGRIVTQAEDWSQLWGLSQNYIVSLRWVGSWPEQKLKTLTSNCHIKSKLSADFCCAGKYTGSARANKLPEAAIVLLPHIHADAGVDLNQTFQSLCNKSKFKETLFMCG